VIKPDEFIDCAAALAPDSPIMQAYVLNTLCSEYELHCQGADKVGHKPMSPGAFVEQFLLMLDIYDSSKGVGNA
jgi:hypothetical protein